MHCHALMLFCYARTTITPVLMLLCGRCLQISTIGKAETAFNPGVKIPTVVAESAAARAGFQSGDLILKVAGVDVPAAPNQVRHRTLCSE